MELIASLKSFSITHGGMNVVQLQVNCHDPPEQSDWSSALFSQLAKGDDRIPQVLFDNVWQQQLGPAAGPLPCPFRISNRDSGLSGIPVEASTLRLPDPHSADCIDRACAGIALVQRSRHLIRSAAETGLVTTSCRTLTAVGYESKVMASHARDWKCGASIPARVSKAPGRSCSDGNCSYFWARDWHGSREISS